MLLVGLTGGIGSGKSTVAGLLAGRGAVIVDADTIARQVVEPGTSAYQSLVARFGPSVVLPDGRLDRPALASVVFADPSSLADLNAITHPAIRSQMAAQASSYLATDRVVVLDIPLLKPETRDEFGIEAVIVVDVAIEVAVSRLVSSRGMSEADARARIAAQMSRSDRCRLADLVIDNSGSLGLLEASVGRAWSWLEGMRVRQGDSPSPLPLPASAPPPIARGGGGAIARGGGGGRVVSPKGGDGVPGRGRRLGWSVSGRSVAFLGSWSCALGADPTQSG